MSTDLDIEWRHHSWPELTYAWRSGTPNRPQPPILGVLTRESAYLTGSGIVAVGKRRLADQLLLGPSYFLYGLHGPTASRPPSARATSSMGIRGPSMCCCGSGRSGTSSTLPCMPGRGRRRRPAVHYVPATDWPALRRQPDLPEPDTSDNPDSDGGLAQPGTRARIARQLNPDASPTFVDPQAAGGRFPEPCERSPPARPAGPRLLATERGERACVRRCVDRRVESEDGSRDEVLVPHRDLH